jgi:hypothetical protein
MLGLSTRRFLLGGGIPETQIQLFNFFFMFLEMAYMRHIKKVWSQIDEKKVFYFFFEPHEIKNKNNFFSREKIIWLCMGMISSCRASPVWARQPRVVVQIRLQKLTRPSGDLWAACLEFSSD